MDVRFADDKMERLDRDRDFDAGLDKEVVTKFRMRMQLIRAADDERAFYAMKSLHFEKLKGKRSHQRSMRLNKKWRLIIEIKESKPKNIAVIVSIEDYH